MKKKCTNSSCRRVFRVRGEKAVCPFCGKEYPRLSRDEMVFILVEGTNPYLLKAALAFEKVVPGAKDLKVLKFMRAGMTVPCRRSQAEALMAELASCRKVRVHIVSKSNRVRIWMDPTTCSRKIKAIKAVRDAFDVSLKEAKTIVETDHPILIGQCSRKAGATAIRRLQEAGIRAQIRNAS